MTDKIEELIERLRAWGDIDKDYGYHERAQCFHDAAAALRTQRNEVVEECARMAEEYSWEGKTLRENRCCAATGCDISTAIRNLKTAQR